jgi:DNA-binding IclR family transcriptional regulator
VKLASCTITDPDRLKASLQEIREKGYAEAGQEQYDDSGIGIVAPVKGVRGEVVAALGVSIPRFRYTEELRAQILPAVVEAAAKVSRSVGGNR